MHGFASSLADRSSYLPSAEGMAPLHQMLIDMSEVLVRPMDQLPRIYPFLVVAALWSVVGTDRLWTPMGDSSSE